MKKTCPSCGGSGQVSYFQGVSRFLLTSEECPECSGVGYLEEKGPDSAESQFQPGGRKKKKKE